MQWLVVSALSQETKKHRNQKVGSEGTRKLETRIGSCNLLLARQIWS